MVKAGVLETFILNMAEVRMGFHKSTLVVRGAGKQLDPSCISATLATHVDLFACFAERLFKSYPISCLTR